jgi:hypothetical protein
VYSIQVLPLSVVRWIGFSEQDRGKPITVPPSATLSVESLYALAGFMDVIVFFATRRGLLLFGDDDAPGMPGGDDDW